MLRSYIPAPGLQDDEVSWRFPLPPYIDPCQVLSIVKNRTHPPPGVSRENTGYWTKTFCLIALKGPFLQKSAPDRE